MRFNYSNLISALTALKVFPPASGGATAWGTITGTLSAQTDLNTALNGKFPVPTGTTAQYIRGDGSLATFPGGSATWGAITGTLSAQTDLNTALNSKVAKLANSFRLYGTDSSGAETQLFYSVPSSTDAVVVRNSNAQIQTRLARWGTSFISSATTVNGTHGKFLFCDATSGAFTLGFDSTAAGFQGAEWTVKKTDASANAVTVSSAQGIDGSTTVVLAAQYDYVTLASNGTGFYIVGRS